MTADSFAWHPVRSSILDGSWRKLGLVYPATLNPSWGPTHALVPTVGEIGRGCVRVYCSFLDGEGRGRIGWFQLDLNAKPSISKVSERPYLDLTSPGFCADGTGLGSFYPGPRGPQLAYLGFQRQQDVKFRAFSGTVPVTSGAEYVARGVDSQLILNRDVCSTIEGIHDVVQYQNELYCFFSCGDGFITLEEADKPRYEVKLGIGPSLSRLRVFPEPVVAAEYPIYRIGRSRVSRLRSGWEMLVTAGTIDGSYYPRVFHSSDLVSWVPAGEFPIPLGEGDDPDSRAICYVERFSLGEVEYVLYNGNDMGRGGVCLAIQDH